MSSFGQLKRFLKRRYGGSGEFAALCSAAYSAVEEPARARLQFLATQSALNPQDPNKVSADDFSEACRLVLKDLAPGFMGLALPRPGTWLKLLSILIRCCAVLAASTLLMTAYTGPWIMVTLITVALGFALVVVRMTSARARLLCGVFLGTLAVAAFLTVLPIGFLSAVATALYFTGILV